VAALEELKHQLNIPMTIAEVLLAGDRNFDDRAFYDKVEEMADLAFDDQCTGANPRYPLIQDLKELYLLAYQGDRVGAAPFQTKGESRPEAAVL